MANSLRATALGSGAGATATDANAFGNDSTASNVGSTAVGMGALSSGVSSIAIAGASGVINQVQATGDRSIAIGASGAIAPGTNATAIGGGAQANANNSIAIGSNNATGAGNAAFVAAAAVNGIAIGNGAQVSAANSVALGAGSVASAPNTVSVGAPGAERRLTNLAPGVLPTDAATVSQLGAMTGGLQTQVNGLQNQVGGLQNQVNSLTKESRRGVAAAIALGSGKTPSAPGKTTIALGSGFYHGETGVGVAVEHWLDFATIPIVVQAGFANGGGNENAGRVGVAFEF